MQLTLKEAAELTGGQLFGSEHIVIRATGTLSSARQGEITFIETARGFPRLERSPAEAVLAPRDLQPKDRPYIQVEDVRAAFAKLVAYFRPPRRFTRIGVSPLANVHPSAVIAEDVDVYPGAWIAEDVEIGPDGRVYFAVINCNTGTTSKYKRSKW